MKKLLVLILINICSIVNAQTVQEKKAQLEYDMQACYGLRYTEYQGVLLDIEIVDGSILEVQQKLVELGETHPQYYSFSLDLNDIESDFIQVKSEWLIDEYQGDWYFSQGCSYYSTGLDHYNNQQWGLAYTAFDNGINACVIAVDKWLTFQSLCFGNSTTINGRLVMLSSQIDPYLP